jgi:hypothetical protein
MSVSEYGLLWLVFFRLHRVGFHVRVLYISFMLFLLFVR